MKVSVVVPAYNAESCLEAAVASVFATNCPDVEVIIVEDASEDLTLHVAEAIRARDPNRVKVVRHAGTRNQGVGASRNVGMQNARGDVIAFLDADDLYRPIRFDKCIDYIVNERSDVVFEKAEVIYSDRASLDELNGQKYLYLSNSDDKDVSVALLYDMPQTGAVTFRRSLLARSGMFNEGLSIGQDREFFIRLSAVGKVKNIVHDKPVSEYIRHGSNRWQIRMNDWTYVAVIGSALRWLESSGVRPDLWPIYSHRLLSWTFEQSDNCLAVDDFVSSYRYLSALGVYYPGIWRKKSYYGNLAKLFKSWSRNVCALY